ncbi:hypothetical protein HBH56_044350 [Parastagonospora nodorum]|uniref:Uncharacterized protein n=2 Tax=Phaeosphaeria nodorum (strain SN15 / ATCC MYA-4574 / FGSC 10173) TaxID=321614 RepID=A0A7U2ETG4_PHANO|nr:hypothetical protein HBH56_044350 [Parastagonospora nodorum]QRC92771.1 hypothetical protein JI435_081720 [Parastagonospora nodorum SN15]KAH3933412.1 hypothetical protein HBH54_072100 [Parastagonospora nodorum]KAH3946368.1 hypothetical protein HBH53_131290 [Parastagonospora nodorum]KAH4004271.1 hypothetical protein HBI10_051110 [Parastagonospora nodorum]
MVLNLFIPPGEGQYRLIPKRPDPLGANATLQYSVIGSTALAATYTSFASSYARRVHSSHSISKTALFIRSSARLGLWAGALGAAVNWYYYNAFLGVVASEKSLEVIPRKLYAWTDTRTVDDGALAGAALGFAASIPTLFMRRPAIPRWTRCLGMTNIGACAGLLGAHGYLQYNGERQKAYKRLERRLRARSFEFWRLASDLELMSQFDPVMQHFIRHNGVLHAAHFAFDMYEKPGHDAVDAPQAITATDNPGASVPTEPPQEIGAYYVTPIDYVENLANIHVGTTRAKMQELEAEKQTLLKEAEYLLYMNAQQQYTYCHKPEMDEEERQRRRQEIHLCEITYNRLRSMADGIDIRLCKWRQSLQHKLASDAGNDSLDSWLPESNTIDFKTHDPTLAIQEMENFQVQIEEEVFMFEQFLTEPGHTEQQRERCRRDLEDARILLKAVDGVVWELEKARRRAMARKVPVEVVGIKTVEEKKKTEKDGGGLEAGKS